MNDIVIKNESLSVSFILFHTVLAVLMLGICYLVTGIKKLGEKYNEAKFRDSLMIFIGADLALWFSIIYAIILTAF